MMQGTCWVLPAAARYTAAYEKAGQEQKTGGKE